MTSDNGNHPTPETLRLWIAKAKSEPGYAKNGQLERWQDQLRQAEAPALALPDLSQEHIDALHGSKISDEVIRARGYKTVAYNSELLALGFSEDQARPGLLIPLWAPDGQHVTSVLRPDNPRCFEDKSKGKNADGTYPQKVLKYEFPKGQGMRLDCPPVCQPRMADPATPLWITEGQKKADALASAGLCSLALLGVWNWKGSNELGGKTALADWNNIALNGRPVNIIFDSDTKKNKHIQRALSDLADFLKNKGAKVRTVYLPESDKRGKTGVDDWLADGHTVGELESMLQEPPRVSSKNERVLSGEYIQALGDLGYAFRMLELDYTVEVNGEPLNDALEAEIRTKLRDAGYEKVNVARDAYIADAYKKLYHPIRDYLESTAWDGNDHILELACYFDDEDHVFYNWLVKWLIGAVARVYLNGTQNRVLVLDGPQDIGKSYFVRWLASGLAGKYYIDSLIDPENKDDYIRLMNVWIWEIGELHATTGKADRNALKQFLSSEQVRVRVPYGRYDINRPALTSFIATANNDGGFFNDPTGNRRFAACTLKTIDWNYAKKINVNQLWAQAKALFDAGEPWRWTGEEKELVNAINSRYEVENPVFGWLDDIITDDPQGSVATTQILAELRFLGARGTDTGLSRDISSYMKKRGVKNATVDAGKDGQGKRVQRRGWQGIALQKPGAGQRVPQGVEESEVPTL